MIRRRSQGDGAGAGAQCGLRCQKARPAHAHPSSHHQHPAKNALMCGGGARQGPGGPGAEEGHGPLRDLGGGRAGKVCVGQGSDPIPGFPGEGAALRKQKALGDRRPQHRARGRPRISVQAAGQIQGQHRRIVRIHPLKAVR